MNELEDIKKILDDDEVINLSIKPNKKRATFINIFSSGLLFFFIATTFLVIGILGILDIINFRTESGEHDIVGAISFTVFGSIPYLIAIINMISQIVRYKNLYYVVTNKRLIVRSGFIGVDYKSLSINSVSVIDVRVDFLDKLVKPNTGSIIFASASNPIVSSSGKNNERQFAFNYLDDPYDTYKRIKTLIGNNN